MLLHISLSIYFSYNKMSSFHTGLVTAGCLLVTLDTSFTLALTKRLLSTRERKIERERGGRGGSQKLLQNACIPSSRSTTPEYTNVNKKDIIKVREERALTVEIEIKATHLLLHSSFPEFPLLLISHARLQLFRHCVHLTTPDIIGANGGNSDH